MAFLLHKILRHNLFAKLTILRKIKEKPDHHTLVAPLSAVYNEVYNQERVTMTCVLNKQINYITCLFTKYWGDTVLEVIKFPQ